MNGDVAFGPFIVLETPDEDRERLQTFTHRVMRWAADVWILDLTGFEGYWRNRATAVGLRPGGLWRRVLDRLFGEVPLEMADQVVVFAPAYRAACAGNPWLGVLMLQALREENITGLVFEHSRRGRSLLQELSWEAWWQAIDGIIEHLAGGRRGFKPAGFRGQCRRLQAAAPRLGFGRPGEMQVLNADSVRRRFGRELADLWQWTYGTGMTGAQTLGQAGFPWKMHRFRDPTVVKRCLDHALELRDQMAPLLIEDLDRLCGCLTGSAEQVTRLDWHLTLADLSVVPVPIRFRHPHPLLTEKGSHLTTLLQAEYAFAAAVRERFPPSLDGAMTDVPSVIGWEIVLSDTLSVPDVIMDIFGETTGRGREIEALLRLENELPVGLTRFRSCSDWLPEDSYRGGPLSGEVISEVPELDPSLTAVAEERPLYIRTCPLPLPDLRRETAGRFLESTMDKWWRRGEGTAIERTYFKHIDPDGNAVWVFRDSSGHWYQHGIFG
jgi:hypothetical protein